MLNKIYKLNHKNELLKVDKINKDLVSEHKSNIDKVAKENLKQKNTWETVCKKLIKNNKIALKNWENNRKAIEEYNKALTKKITDLNSKLKILNLTDNSISYMGKGIKMLFDKCDFEFADIIITDVVNIKCNNSITYSSNLLSKIKFIISNKCNKLYISSLGVNRFCYIKDYKIYDYETDEVYNYFDTIEKIKLNSNVTLRLKELPIKPVGTPIPYPPEECSNPTFPELLNKPELLVLKLPSKPKPTAESQTIRSKNYYNFVNKMFLN